MSCFCFFLATPDCAQGVLLALIPVTMHRRGWGTVWDDRDRLWAGLMLGKNSTHLLLLRPPKEKLYVI